MAPTRCEANSVNSTATSNPGETYRCRHCEKTFRNGQALGGHQNAHRVVHRGVIRRMARAMGSLRNPRQLVADHSSFESGEVNQVNHHPGSTSEPGQHQEGKTRIFLGEWRDKAAEDPDSERTVSDSIVPRRPCYKGKEKEVSTTTLKNLDIDLELKLGM